MISYKHYDINNLSDLLENKEFLKEIHKIKYENEVVEKNYISRLTTYLFSNKQNIEFFLILKDGKPIGFNQGLRYDNKYFSENQYILKEYRDKGYGKKLKLRVVAYLRAKKRVTLFSGRPVVNNRMYSINEFIANRKQKTSKGRYVLEKDPLKNKPYLSKDGKEKPRTVLKFVKRK